MTATSEAREVVLKGATVHIHTSGAGATTYVLIHGIGVSSRYFRPLGEELAREALVHNVDLPGHGRSPKPARPLSVPDYARVLWAALDRIGVEAPVLVGHSMGAQIAAEMALAGRQLAGVVLLGPTNYAAERGFWRQALRLGQDTLREPFAVNAVVFTDYAFRCGLPWYLKTTPAMLGHHIEDAVGGIGAPLLIGRGAKDPLVPRRWIEELAALRPGAETAEVAGEAHVLMMKSAPEVARLCRKLVAPT
ncbi:dihydrolipoamide acetyltransferase [Zafaria cholistanensis]|uniref:Dihydrolipoamide acetyltransferase n=1 Tax=Zafaria cholistanensis TaxID=1682741 RepID=A0A5A7NRA4_9MICC|nr:alpha/beta fold hydrolase [Zafaria cholistanensis]GER23086.1 dihydrolipoamide acetyltransferase [Zafaria cholistanensis]